MNVREMLIQMIRSLTNDASVNRVGGVYRLYSIANLVYVLNAKGFDVVTVADIEGLFARRRGVLEPHGRGERLW